MSFKRDGDDRNALNNQRKRRVADLLYEDIHDEELSRLRNGKYMCKICPHRPLFDTVNMFQVHRQGKKHQYSVEYQERKKQELKDLISKGQHEQELCDEELQNKISKEERGVPLGSNKTSKSGPYGRKMRLDIIDVKSTNAVTNYPVTANSQGNHIEDRSADVNTQRQPGHSQKDSRRKTLHLTKEVKASCNQTCDSNSTKVSIPLGGSSFKSFAQRQREPQIDEDLKSNDVKQFIKHGGDISSHSKFYHSRKQRTTAKPLPNVQLNLERQHTVIEQHTSLSWDRFKQTKGKSFVAPVHQKKMKQETSDLQGSTCKVGDSLSSVKPCTSTDESSVQKEKIKTAESSAEKKERAKEFLNAFESGWKRDWNGGWIKDEEVEFDSDEEPPTVT